MANKKSYSIEEILQASEDRKTIKGAMCLPSHLMLRTKLGVTLGLEDASKIKKIIDLIESTYNVKLSISGGGYGCTKINFVVDGKKDAVELSKELLKDNEFKKLTKETDLELLITIDKISRIGSSGDAASQVLRERETPK